MRVKLEAMSVLDLQSPQVSRLKMDARIQSKSGSCMCLVSISPMTGGLQSVMHPNMNTTTFIVPVT